MAWKAKRPCRKQGCRELVSSGYCRGHRQEYERARGSSSERGYGAKWREARAAFLKRHPTCKECDQPATTVDHIIPHRGDMGLFWDTSNWAPMCERHHNRKTATKDGGFGRSRL